MGRRHNGAHYKDVYRMKTKRGGGVGGGTHRGLEPLFIFFFFLSPEVNGTFSLKQSLLSWVEKPRKKALGRPRVVEWRVRGREM